MTDYTFNILNIQSELLTRQTESEVSEVWDNGMQVMKFIWGTHKRFAITYVLTAFFTRTQNIRPQVIENIKFGKIAKGNKSQMSVHISEKPIIVIMKLGKLKTIIILWSLFWKALMLSSNIGKLHKVHNIE